MQKYQTQLLGLLILVALFFAPVLTFDFTFDDNQHVLNNPLFQNPVEIGRLLLSPTWPGNLYRPLFYLTLAITELVFGLSPFILHLENLLLHLAFCCAAYFLLRKLIDHWSAFLAVALFALHPIHTEVVANISYRTEALAGLFVVLALLAMFSKTFEGVRKSLIIFFCALFAFGSKESSLSLLFLAPCLWYIRHLKFATPKREFLVAYLPMIVAATIYLLVRYLVLSTFHPPSIEVLDNFLVKLPPLIRFANAVALLGKYINLMAFPLGLHADYSPAQIMPISNWFDLTLIINLCAISCLCLLTIVFVNYRSIHAIWGLWFLCTFMVTSNILLPIGTVFADRLAYLPSLAMCGAVASGIHRVSSKVMKYLLASLLLSACALITANYLPHWKSDSQLWEAEIQGGTSSAKAFHIKAIELFANGLYLEAANSEEQALRLYPNFIDSEMLLQRCYQRLGDWSKAEELLQSILVRSQNFAPAYESLGWVNVGQNKIAEAKVNFLKALNLDTKYRSAEIGLFAVAVREGNVVEASSIESRLLQCCSKDPRVNYYHRILESAQR